MPSPLELKTDEKYIQFLTEQYGWQIQEPSYTTVPQPHEQYIGRNQHLFDLMVHYLTGTYIIKDQFDTDHRARHDFLEEIKLAAPNVREWIKVNSKLRKNRIITDVISCMDAIVNDLEDTFPELYQRLENFTAPLYQSIAGYNKMVFNEKIAFVHQVDDLAYRFLEELER